MAIILTGEKREQFIAAITDLSSRGTEERQLVLKTLLTRWSDADRASLGFVDMLKDFAAVECSDSLRRTLEARIREVYGKAQRGTSAEVFAMG